MPSDRINAVLTENHRYISRAVTYAKLDPFQLIILQNKSLSLEHIIVFICRFCDPIHINKKSVVNRTIPIGI